MKDEREGPTQESAITFEIAAAWMGTGRHNDDFEIIGEWFRRETGYLRPGKDCRTDSLEDRQEAWEKWQPLAVSRMALWLVDQQDKLRALESQPAPSSGIAKLKYETSGFNRGYDAGFAQGVAAGKIVSQSSIEAAEAARRYAEEIQEDCRCVNAEALKNFHAALDKLDAAEKEAGR